MNKETQGKMNLAIDLFKYKTSRAGRTSLEIHMSFQFDFIQLVFVINQPI